MDLGTPLSLEFGQSSPFEEVVSVSGRLSVLSQAGQ
jgi:hypothetical protein